MASAIDTRQVVKTNEKTTKMKETFHAEKSNCCELTN